MKMFGYVPYSEMKYRVDELKNDLHVYKGEFRQLEREVDNLKRINQTLQPKVPPPSPKNVVVNSQKSKPISTSDVRNSSSTYVDNSMNDAIMVSTISSMSSSNSYNDCSSSSYDSGSSYSSYDSGSSSCDSSSSW